MLALVPAILLGLGLRSSSPSSSCRCFPDEPCWPFQSEWTAFNASVDGKLISATPLAAPCHDSVFEPYNEGKCNRIRDHWFYPETQVDSPNSPMAPFFSNNGCNPFSARDEPCVIGTDVRYVVDARDAADYKATLDSVRRHNLGLVIRNSGHDYLGRSTGACSLSIAAVNMMVRR